jgi:cyclopropane-fatty-acyl-phospholipid synthase
MPLSLIAALRPSLLERRIEALKNNITAPFRLELWDGRRFQFSPQPTVTIRVPSAAALKYFAKPSLDTLAQAYIEGQLDVDGPLGDIIEVADRLSRADGHSPLEPVRQRTKRHHRKLDAEAISYHYDVSNEFYSLWLDRNMVYSCAYFQRDDDSLDAAQEQKLDYICRKLRLQPGERFLDIGCGWGGLIRWAASHYGVHATGITLSKQQHAYATERIRCEGLQDRCEALLLDYRDLRGEGCFDKIASVGMFEHVGVKNLPEYFGTVRRLLREQGLFLNHGITGMNPHSSAVGMGAGEFIDRYVFPHGELPHLSWALADMADQKLEVVDVESLRPHYARTLALWAERLVAHKDQAREIAGDRRLRIWQVYLAGCAHGFRQGWMSIYQILASKQAQEGPSALPATREYMYAK